VTVRSYQAGLKGRRHGHLFGLFEACLLGECKGLA
jgi:hypothetical protein